MFIEVENTRGNKFLLNVAKIITIDAIGDDAVSVNFAFDRVVSTDANGNTTTQVQETRCTLPIPFEQIRKVLSINGAILHNKSVVAL